MPPTKGKQRDVWYRVQKSSTEPVFIFTRHQQFFKVIHTESLQSLITLMDYLWRRNLITFLYKLQNAN